MSNKLTRYKQLEDWLCKFIDDSFHDDILADKEFNPDTMDCRAVFISNIGSNVDDQDALGNYTVSFKEIRNTRAELVKDISILEQILPFYNKIIGKGLVISGLKVYITPPMRTMVGSKSAYMTSATIKIVTT